MLGGTPFAAFLQAAGGGVTPVTYPSFLPDGVSSCCTINNTPVESWGCTVESFERWLDVPSNPVVEVEMVRGLTGGRVKPLSMSSPREMLLTGHYLETTMGGRHALHNAFVDSLRGLLEVVTPDAPDYVMRAIAGKIEVQPIGMNRQYWLPELRVTVPLTCPDAAKYKRHARMVRLGTTPAAVQLGSLPSGGEIIMQGPLSGTVHIDLLAPTGQRIYRLTLEIPVDEAIEAGGHLRIRLDYPTAMLHYEPDGTVSSVEHWRSLASSRWWMPTPRYADAERDSWPLLVTSTGDGIYRYYEAMAA